MAQPISNLTTRLIAGGSGILRGWSVRETSSAAGAVFQVFDGTDANGQLAASVALKPGESTRDWFSEEGVKIESGLFLNVVSGVMEGAVYFHTPEGL